MTAAKTAAKIRVFVTKDSDSTYSVWRYVFDRRGMTVDHGVVKSGLKFREAHQLKRDIIDLDTAC